MSLAAVQPLGDIDKKDLIFGGFRGEIRPVPLSPVYRGALAIVAVAMVLLPLVYVALVGGAAYGVYWFATHGWSLLSGIGSFKLRGFVFVTPLLAGAILVLFMIKPLLARPARQGEPRRLRREEEPLLFAFVDRICETVGAPKPREIRVDGEVNASASFRRGFFSLFSNDLVLTLGLPLVAGLSLPQLAGILAHEFGHFAQRAGLRLSYVIRSVNGWFARVVYERDRYDEQLQQAVKEADYRIQVMLWVAVAFVWLSRRVLWVLMMVGHTLSSFLLRQMELDADRYEARLVGREVARSTFGDIFGLSLCFQHAVTSVDDLWREGKLGDRFPRLVAARYQSLGERAPGLYADYLAESKTGLFDTHPSDRDRIASIAREAEAGVFSCELPATALFRDFEAVEKSFSSELYREILGERFHEGRLVSVEESVAAQQQAAADVEVVERYLEHDPNALWRLPLPRELPPPPADPLAELQQARQAMAAQREAHAMEVEAHGAAYERLRSALVAENALRAGFQINAESFGLKGGELDHAVQARELAATEIEGIESRLQAMEQVAARRLLTALAVPASPAEISRPLACAVFLGEIRPRLGELLRLQTGLGSIASWLQSNESTQAASNRLNELSAEIGRRLQTLAAELAAQPYPFDDRGAGVTLARYAQLDEPLGHGVGDIAQANATALSNLFSLSIRVLAHLARAAEEVERGLGLAPMGKS